MKKENIKIILANPRGFCAGVERAIAIVEKALKKYGPPIYVRHEIVHNKYVVEKLQYMGAIFVDEIEQIPKDAVVIFSAHGVSQAVEDEAQFRKLNILDATCPLVKKVHKEAQNYISEGRKLILIGHKNHPEIEGTSGRVQKDEVLLVENLEQLHKLDLPSDMKLSYVTQTTLSVDDTKHITDALHTKYTDIKGASSKDICYATQNRQDAVKKMVQHIELLVVIGSTNSSNSNRLKDLGTTHGVESHLIDNAEQLDLSWLFKKKVIGITAGASAPEILLEQILYKLESHYNIDLEEMSGIQENIKFNTPKILENL